MRIYKVRCYSVLQSLPLLATAAMLPTVPTTICYSQLPPKSRTRHGTTGAGAPSTVQTLMTSKSKGNYLTILPLIALLLLDFLNSNLGPQLSESNAPKWFCEDVPELSSCLDILELDLSTVDAITDEVILGVNVLAPVVVDGVLC